MAEPGESLIPGDDLDQRVDAAVASALAEETEEGEPEAVPFGRSWNFDFEQGRFVHEGSGAMRVYGGTALSMWCLMALHSTRFAHDVFSEAFGVENVDDLIGSAMSGEIGSEYEARMREALLVHDRIVALEDFTVEFDPADDAVYVSDFTVVTDEDERVSVDGTAVGPGGTV